MISIYEDDGHVYAEHIAARFDDDAAVLKVRRLFFYTFVDPERTSDEQLYRDERAARTLAKDAERHADNIAKIRADRHPEQTEKAAEEAPPKSAKRRRKSADRKVASGALPDTQPMAEFDGSLSKDKEKAMERYLDATPDPGEESEGE